MRINIKVIESFRKELLYQFRIGKRWLVYQENVEIKVQSTHVCFDYNDAEQICRESNSGSMRISVLILFLLLNHLSELHKTTISAIAIRFIF